MKGKLPLALVLFTFFSYAVAVAPPHKCSPSQGLLDFLIFGQHTQSLVDVSPKFPYPFINGCTDLLWMKIDIFKTQMRYFPFIQFKYY